MNKQTTILDGLILKATDYIKFKLNYSNSIIHKYTTSWRRLKDYIVLNDIKNYNRDVEKKILNHVFKDRTKRELTDREQYFYLGIQKLAEFQQTGKIEVRDRPKYPRDFKGTMGEVINQFLEYKRVEERLTYDSLRTHRRNLFHFFNYCNKNNIQSPKEINIPVIIEFICTLDSTKPSVISLQICTLRNFTKFSFEKGYIDFDYSNKLPKYKLARQAKLPSIYSTEEIQKLISSVERTSSVGKRNYAIILIAARLGLRAFDIARLQFSNLQWDSCTLKLKQSKTGRDLILPLLPDVGNAIIDYLKYGRSKSEEPYVFLKERPPYGPFPTSTAITHVVQRAFINAGINIRNKKFGPHALRHTLGFRMLEESTILPVISQVLGHNNGESSKFYLRIDLKSMRGCVLEVPPITKEFYEQRGGAFYE